MSRNNPSSSIKDSRSLSKPDPMLPIPVSLLIGTILTVYPVPYTWLAWRPELMLMLTLFWVMVQPKWCGIWFAFFVGLLTDFMLDSQLGLHAFVFVVLSFLAKFFMRNKRMLTFLNLWIISTVAVLSNLILLFIFQRISGNVLSLWFWGPLLPSIIVWPLIYTFLKRWRGV
ncbi:rod shape-determining protein MreD [Aquirhabdus parva]|uniref:Rod shape-determining protein MreD n=1 Tax=Aquirhabdus parva TaxID=2283318 RepID=A0A345P730_9GAMM|nr:rod shape-determining protein MreD [Aquirhabdus parva]AXI03089.1 rod shape-determining protein MreD [Aquirhabdus parva]